MIDTNIWKHGAVSITVSVSLWKDDKVTVAEFTCRIEHGSHSPSAVVATRDSALAAERECVAAFIEQFSKKPKGVANGTKALRPTKEVAKPKPITAKKIEDDFEY